MASQSSEEKRTQKTVVDERLQPRPKLPPQIIGGIAAGIAGAVLLVAGLLWWAVKKKLLVMPLVLLVLALAGLAVYVITNREQLRNFWQQRTSRQFVNSAAFAFFVVGILVLVNIIAARHFVRHDFTQNKEFSLSEQTRKILADLKQPLEILAFVSPDYYNSEELRSRLREYDIASPKTKLEIIDPKTALDKVREYNVQFDGTIILKYGDKKEEVTGGNEEQITSAILALTKGEKTKVYFLSGHGERRLDGYGEDGIADFKRSLENQQYEVKELVLLKEKEPKVPADCAVLCIIGPQQPLLKKEIDAINKYLGQGGKALICLEIPPAPNLKEIIASHGVTPLEGVVFDPTYNFLGNIGMPLVVQPEEHDVTRNLQGLFFPGARAL
ncbi:MAG: GldG family protein, partial [Armatimonadetes bacterium]|nr:GldG family protein [Armatimonadota bacterium]